jgi:hypothetical protein
MGQDTSRRKVFYALTAGLLLGSLIGPAAAWAAERVEVNWPSVFRIEASRDLPVKVQGDVNVQLDRYNTPTVKVEVEKLPTVKVEGGRMTMESNAPIFSPIRETATETLFVAGEPDGECQIFRLDHGTGKISSVGTFEL